MVESLACFHFQTVNLAVTECIYRIPGGLNINMFLSKKNLKFFRRDELPGFPVFSRSLASSKPAQNGKVPYNLFIDNLYFCRDCRNCSEVVKNWKNFLGANSRPTVP